MAEHMRSRNKRHREKEVERRRGKKRLCRGLARRNTEEEVDVEPDEDYTNVSRNAMGPDIQLEKEGLEELEEAKKLDEEKKLKEAKKMEKVAKLMEAKKLKATKKMEKVTKLTEARKLKAAKKLEEAKQLEEAKRLEEAKKLEEAKRLEEAKKLEEAKRLEEAKKNMGAWAEALRRKSQESWSAKALAASETRRSSSSSEGADYDDDIPWEGCEDSDQDMRDPDDDEDDEDDEGIENDNDYSDDVSVCDCEHCVAKAKAKAGKRGNVGSNHLQVDSSKAAVRKPTIRNHSEVPGEPLFSHEDLEAFAEEGRLKEWGQMEEDIRRKVSLAILQCAEKWPNKLVFGKISRRMIELSGNGDTAQRMRFLYSRLPQTQTGVRQLNEERLHIPPPTPPTQKAATTRVETLLPKLLDRSINTKSLMVPKEDHEMVEHTCMTWEQATQQAFANLAMLASASRDQGVDAQFQFASTQSEVREQVAIFERFMEDGKQIAATFKKSLDRSPYAMNAARKMKLVQQYREKEKLHLKWQHDELEKYRLQKRDKEAALSKAVHRATASGSSSTSEKGQRPAKANRATDDQASALSFPPLTTSDSNSGATQQRNEVNETMSAPPPLPDANDGTWSAPVNEDYSKLAENALNIKRNAELRLARLEKCKEPDSQNGDSSTPDQIAEKERLRKYLEFQERYRRIQAAQDSVRPRPVAPQASTSNESPSEPGANTVDSGAPGKGQVPDKEWLNRPMMLGR
ncbi:MAG: hypothetical protein M1812_004639 [Candelaria pacifica]|nr:MAG: hypothetical protein M1812_004639 [Candelaria pacifica]